MAGRGKLIAVLGDEDTVTGFLLGGVGELNKHRKPNFLVVEKDTSLTEIEETFRCAGAFLGVSVPPVQPPPPIPASPRRSFLAREDIGIILINQFIAELIRHVLDGHTRSLPAVLEIPSKEHPYDATKDSILRRARGMFTAEDLR
ncbi:V-type proton ATPase subunit F isoform X1 [Emys orbicularis]|uniref:V-type proton ATPase subunit F isoform X1 n=1 Tax=Emys orbicularis TaxID=82168 RepID=UPI0031FC2359